MGLKNDLADGDYVVSVMAGSKLSGIITIVTALGFIVAGIVWLLH